MPRRALSLFCREMLTTLLVGCFVFGLVLSARASASASYPVMGHDLGHHDPIIDLDSGLCLFAKNGVTASGDLDPGNPDPGDPAQPPGDCHLSCVLCTFHAVAAILAGPVQTIVKTEILESGKPRPHEPRCIIAVWQWPPQQGPPFTI